MEISRGRLAFTLIVLFLINALNFYDRQVLGAAGERIRSEWSLNDAQLSQLTTAFIFVYAAIGLPLGHWADLGRRKLILSIGVFIWCIFTALAGRAWDFTSLLVLRMCVGVGEASCAPTANSLLGDLFPPHKRARAIALFMLGLPLGLGLSHLVSGYVIERWDWRGALYVAGVPGLLLGVLAWFLPDPPRGATEAHGASRGTPEVFDGREERTKIKVASHALRSTQGVPPRRKRLGHWGCSIAAVLRIPTMWWIILSGMTLNFCMYALGTFLVSFLKRYHHLDDQDANWIAAVAYGFGGCPGMLLGGLLGDRAARHGVAGRMRIAAFAALIATPCFWLAWQQPEKQVIAFAVFLLPGCVCLYIYYSTVYASIQDVVEPKLRGTAMAVYFFVFYVGTYFGLQAFGRYSDFLRERNLATGMADGVARSLGLHDAMLNVLPLVTLALTGILYAGSLTIGRDHARLQEKLAKA